MTSFQRLEILQRWNESVEELFDSLWLSNSISSDIQGPIILKSDVERRLKEMISGKAEGIDNISTEIL